MRQGDFSEVGTIYDPLTTVARPRRGRHAPALPRQRHSAKPLGPGDGQVDQCVSDADHVRHCPTTWSRPRRARRTGISSTCASITRRANGTTSSAVIPGRRRRPSIRTRSRPSSFPVCRKPSASAMRTPSRALQICWAEHAVFGWVHVFSSRLLLDSRAGYNHFNLEFTQADVVTGDQLGEQLGVPNANQQLGQDGIPIFSPANYTGIGHSRSLPIFRHEKTFQSVTNLTFAGEKHTIKAGFDLRRRHMGEFQTNRGNGRFNFSPNITNNPVNNTGGHVMASFLLGAPSLIEQDYLLASDVGMRSTEYSVYVADDWRATQTADVEPRAALRARHAVHRSGQPVGQLRSEHRHGPRRRPQRREQERRASRPSRRPLRRVSALPTRLHSTPSCAAERVSSGTRRATAAPRCGCTATCRSGRSTASTPARNSSRGACSDGFPTIPPLDLALADNPSGSVIGVDPNYQPGYAEQFNLTVEQELPWALLLKMSYVGNIGKHLDTTYNLNQAVPGTGAVNKRRPFFAVRPALADVNWAVSDGTAVVSRVSVQRPEAVDARVERPALVYLGPFSRHGGPELRRRRGRAVAAGPAQSPRESRQFAVRHAPSSDDRLELCAARRLAGQRHQHVSDGFAVHADAQCDDAQYRYGPAPRPHRRRQAVGPDRGPLVRHLSVYDAGAIHVWQCGPEYLVRARAA